MTCPDYAERLREFAAGQLSGLEADTVLQHVFTCPDCSAEFDLLADITQAVSSSAEDTSTVENQPAAAPSPETEHPTYPAAHSPPLVFARFSRLAVAASLLCAVALGAWSFLPESRNPWLGVLTDVTPLPFVEGTLRSRDDDRDADFAAAMVAYNDNDYATATPLLQKLVAADPGDHKLRVYLAVALLQRGYLRGVPAVLQPAIDADSGLVGERARWYLGMHWLLRENYGAAVRTFGALRDHGGRYAALAAEMLSKIATAAKSQP